MNRLILYLLMTHRLTRRWSGAVGRGTHYRRPLIANPFGRQEERGVIHSKEAGSLDRGKSEVEMNKSFLAAGALFMAMLCGCTVTYNANPVSIADLDPREICVIEDTRVNASFLPAFRRALERKGFSVRVLPSNSPVSTCPLTSTYVATWSWDFVPYMAYSNIVVYRDGNRVGEAVYDAPRAGWAMTTEIYEATDTKVSTMVDRLFLQSRL